MRNNPFRALELYKLKIDPQKKTHLAARIKMFNELATTLRAHIQRGGATPWQMPPEGSFP